MRLASGGVVLGLAFGVLTRLVLRLMHRRGHKAPEQLALIVGMAYLSFYVANGPCESSLLYSMQKCTAVLITCHGLDKTIFA